MVSEVLEYPVTESIVFAREVQQIAVLSIECSLIIACSVLLIMLVMSRTRDRIVKQESANNNACYVPVLLTQLRVCCRCLYRAFRINRNR